METSKVILNGVEVEIVTKLDDDFDDIDFDDDTDTIELVSKLEGENNGE